MFRHRQPLRRWAALLLLLWLFGVGAGVANACLAPALTRADGPLAGQGSAATPHAQEHRAGEPAHQHGAPVSEARANCQDFCDKSTLSVPPLKSAIGEVDAHALPPPVAATVLQVPVVRATPPWVPRRNGGLAPPIPIAFLRLAL